MLALVFVLVLHFLISYNQHSRHLALPSSPYSRWLLIEYTCYDPRGGRGGRGILLNIFRWEFATGTLKSLPSTRPCYVQLIVQPYTRLDNENPSPIRDLLFFCISEPSVNNVAAMILFLFRESLIFHTTDQFPGK